MSPFQLHAAGRAPRRRLVLHRLHDWGFPYGSEFSDAVDLLVAELAANAVTHGRTSDQGFELRLVLGGRTLFVNVSNTRGERRPGTPAKSLHRRPTRTAVRGLLSVDALASRWEALDREPAGKAVHAELICRADTASARSGRSS